VALIVEDGTGKSDAEAYVSVADADSYHTKYGTASASWGGADTADKEVALRVATRYLEAKYPNDWRGQKSSNAQALAWPRAGVTLDDLGADMDLYVPGGYVVASDEIPQRLKDATAILASKHIEGDDLLGDVDEPGAIKRTKVKAGPIEEEIEYAGARTRQPEYPLVRGLLSIFLRSFDSAERS